MLRVFPIHADQPPKDSPSATWHKEVNHSKAAALSLPARAQLPALLRSGAPIPEIRIPRGLQFRRSLISSIRQRRIVAPSPAFLISIRFPSAAGASLRYKGMRHYLHYRVALALVFVAGAPGADPPSSPGEPLTAKEVRRAEKEARTADDHLRLAAYYEYQALPEAGRADGAGTPGGLLGKNLDGHAHEDTESVLERAGTGALVPRAIEHSDKTCRETQENGRIPSSRGRHNSIIRAPHDPCLSARPCSCHSLTVAVP